jgi:hypothetical protein
MLIEYAEPWPIRVLGRFAPFYWPGCRLFVDTLARRLLGAPPASLCTPRLTLVAALVGCG